MTLIRRCIDLWESAGLNRYIPAMSGKHCWSVIRKYPYQAVGDKLAKGRNLENMLYVPETSFIDNKDEIDHRHRAVMNPLATDGSRRWLVILEARSA